jgi:hypothetical protein
MKEKVKEQDEGKHQQKGIEYEVEEESGCQVKSKKRSLSQENDEEVRMEEVKVLFLSLMLYALKL